MAGAETYWDTRVASAKNLGEFMFWFAMQPEEAQDLYLNSVYIVLHRSMPEVEPEPVRLRRRDGTVVTIQERRCKHGEDCGRCAAGAGGYKFCWIGPWTKERPSDEAGAVHSADNPEPSAASAA